MATTYLFFEPARLPLDSIELGEATVRPLTDRVGARAALDRAVPGIEWTREQEARAEIDGNWLEFRLPEPNKGTLSMRCSLRADNRAVVQHLCDTLGWLAFDERPHCFQPHRPPMPA